MNKFYEIFLISTSIVGLYVSFTLLVLAKQNRLLNRLLGIFTLTSSVYFLLTYAMIRGWGPEPVILVRTFAPTSLINSAVGYLYFRALIRDEAQLSSRDLIHAIPFVLNLFYYAPLAINLIFNEFQFGDVALSIKPQTYLLPFGPFTEQLIIAYRIVIGSFYIMLSVNLFLNSLTDNLKSQLKYLYPKNKNWIVVCLSGYLLFGGAIIVNQFRIIFSDQPYSLVNGELNAIAILIGWNFIILYIVTKPEILFGIPQFVRSVPELSSAAEAGQMEQPAAAQTPGPIGSSGIYVSDNKPATQNEATDHCDSSSTNPTTDVVPDKKEIEVTEAVKLLLERIHSHIRQHQPYRNQEFNIASLSAALGVPQHHIAFIFRQVLHQSFVEYRNSLRVEYVKESIRSGTHKQITIEAIGTDAGFSSRATFFAVFKDLTGKTPGQYAEECGPNGES